jgi:PleD family two-component response regulator
MDNAAAAPRKPMVAIVGQHEWLTRSVASIFTSSGFPTHALADPDLGVARLDAWRPDVVVLEADPPDILWQQTLPAIQTTDWFSPCTPVLALTAEAISREQRIEAIRAGFWEIHSHPIDAENLVLKTSVFAAAKLEADSLREKGLTDPDTDLYNVRGVLRRIYEEASEATRNRRALACIVTAVEPPVGVDTQLAAGEARGVAEALRQRCRASDVFGRIAANEFVVIAPGTDPGGARTFATRLARGMSPAADGTGAGLRAGFAAVTDARSAAIEPIDLFIRAVSALRAAQATGGDEVVRSWD